MNHNFVKFRSIFIPFLVIAACFIGAYTFLNWLLVIKYDLIPVKDEIIDFWLPIALSWIPVLIWLRPRLKLLRLTKDNARMAFYFFAATTMAVPTIIAQKYLSTATGSITELKSISEVQLRQPTKYYSLDEYYLDKSKAGIYPTGRVSGKRNEKLNLYVYVAIPIMGNAADTSLLTCDFYLGKQYSKSVSNKLSESEKQAIYEEFVLQSMKEFDKSDFGNFVYLEKLGRSDDHDEYEKAVTQSDYRKNNTMVFEAHFDSFESRNGNKFAWIFGSFAMGALVWLFMLQFPVVSQTQVRKFRRGRNIEDSGLKDSLSLVIPRSGYFVTPLIIHLNILVFVVMVFAGLGVIDFRGNDLVQWGANYRPLVEKGQWWRLLTSFFLHGGLMHIIFNMFALALAGIFLEPFIGIKRYVFLYLLSGVLAGCVSLWFNKGIPSVGASGAIFGLYGAGLAFVLMKVVPIYGRRVLLLYFLAFIAYNVVIGFFTTGVDNAGHIGGVLSGFLIGMGMVPFLKKELANRMALKE